MVAVILGLITSLRCLRRVIYFYCDRESCYLTVSYQKTDYEWVIVIFLRIRGRIAGKS
jgi:hypothetical protein